MEIYGLILVFFMGLIAGSFISAFSFRFVRGINFVTDRSRCPHCKKELRWFDNIPLLSYLILGGRCRSCRKKISIRYPLIEILTGSVFVLIAQYKSQVFPELLLNQMTYEGILGFAIIFYYFIIASILISILVIDFEHQIIPDELVFLLLPLAFLSVLVEEKFFLFVLSGFSASIFLYLLNLVTWGKGMGLGDVKLAIPLGMFLGYPDFITWVFLSFIIGGIIGIILLFQGKAKFGIPIAFGPFLIVGFFITWIWGKQLLPYFFPYI